MTDRSALRTALQYHTDGKLTSSTDQDFYLNKAEQDVFADWRKFDPGLFRDVRDSVATDADGIMLLDKEFSRIEFLETSDHKEYLPLTDMRKTPYGTGFYFVGFDTTNNKRKMRVIEGGNPVASTTLYWYNIHSIGMASGTTVESAIPEEHRSLISIRAAFLYYRDKGPAYIVAKDTWKREYAEGIVAAREFYRNPSKQPQYIDSVDPDAGGGSGQRRPGYIS